jgi:hypothetical protein
LLDAGRLKLADTVAGQARDLDPISVQGERISLAPADARICFSVSALESDVWLAQLR